jgi:hypothetical protein
VRRAAEVALRDIGADAADPDRCGHAELPIAELLAEAQAVVGAEVLPDGGNVLRRELVRIPTVCWATARRPRSEGSGWTRPSPMFVRVG